MTCNGAAGAAAAVLDWSVIGWVDASTVIPVPGVLTLLKYSSKASPGNSQQHGNK